MLRGDWLFAFVSMQVVIVVSVVVVWVVCGGMCINCVLLGYLFVYLLFLLIMRWLVWLNVDCFYYFLD